MTPFHLGLIRSRSLQAERITPLLLAGLVALVCGALGTRFAPPEGFAPHVQALAVLQTSSEAVARAVGASVGPGTFGARAPSDLTVLGAVETPSEAVTRQIELDDGQGLQDALVDADVDSGDVRAVLAALRHVHDPRRLKTGQEITLVVRQTGDVERLESLTFQAEPTREVIVRRGADTSFVAETKATPIERHRIAAQAEISGSLYESGRKAGVPRSVLAALWRAYAHAIDFQRDVHAGDRFAVLYDQPTARDGSPVGQAVILYAALTVGGKEFPLYRVVFPDGSADYFDAKGQSVKRSLLRTPVDSAHVTSPFGMRIHPLLGFSKMHTGVDFGAPLGTPIFAAGAGVVEEASWAGGYGRCVRIRHNDRLQTVYGHMNRFSRGLHVGQRVNQGEVIGFVGSTGRSTGPHLHFEVRVAGRPANPLSVNMPTGRTLGKAMMAQFLQGQDRLHQEFSRLLAKAPPPKPESGRLATTAHEPTPPGV